MKVLSRQEIVDAKDMPTQTVEVPEWGGAVIVRVMSAADRNRFEQSIVKVLADGKRVPNLDNWRSKLVAFCVVDEQGYALFGQDEIETLASKSANVIDRLFAIAQKINGMEPDAVEVAAKNSAPGPSAISPSGSPAL